MIFPTGVYRFKEYSSIIHNNERNDVNIAPNRYNKKVLGLPGSNACADCMLSFQDAVGGFFKRHTALRF